MGKRVSQYDSRVHKPIKEEFEGTLFDSGWELNVYKHIRLHFPQDFIKVHYPIPVLPESPAFPALDWKCDFVLNLPWKKYPVYVEAKGVVNREFELILRALAVTNPSVIQHLIVVHSELGRKIGRLNQTVNIHVLCQILQRLKAH